MSESKDEKGKPEKIEGEAGEDVLVWQGEPSLFAFYPFYFIAAFAAICSVLWELSFFFPYWMWGVITPFLAAMLGLPLMFQLAQEYRLTESDVRSEFELWVRQSRVAPLDKVMDATMEQGFVGRLLNFGTVRVDTAGTPFPGVEFWGVRDPFEVEDKVRRAVEADGQG